MVANRASMFFDQLEAMQGVFQSYAARMKRETVAREDVVGLLAEMGVELPLELGVKDRTMDRLEDAGWERIEAWWQDPTERLARARAEAASGAADAAKARDREEIAVAPRLTAEFDDVDDEEVAALEMAASLVGRDSVGNQLMEMVGSFRETLREPVSSQLVPEADKRAKDIEPNGARTEGDDADLSSELEMMQLTEEQRRERALGAGLAADAPWTAIAEAELAARTRDLGLGLDLLAARTSPKAAIRGAGATDARESGGAVVAVGRFSTAGEEALVPALPEPSVATADGPEEVLLPGRGENEEQARGGDASPTGSVESDGLDDSMDFHDVEEH